MAYPGPPRRRSRVSVAEWQIDDPRPPPLRPSAPGGHAVATRLGARCEVDRSAIHGCAVDPASMPPRGVKRRRPCRRAAFSRRTVRPAVTADYGRENQKGAISWAPVPKPTPRETRGSTTRAAIAETYRQNIQARRRPICAPGRYACSISPRAEAKNNLFFRMVKTSRPLKSPPNCLGVRAGCPGLRVARSPWQTKRQPPRVCVDVPLPSLTLRRLARPNTSRVQISLP